MPDIYGRNGRDQPVLLGQAYETSRGCLAQVGGQTVTWAEQIFVVYSPAYAKATAKLQALTPPRGRGKRQITVAGGGDSGLGTGGSPRLQAVSIAALVMENRVGIRLRR